MKAVVLMATRGTLPALGHREVEVGDNTNGGVGDEVNVASEGSLVCIKTSEPDSHTSSETREREGGREGG